MNWETILFLGDSITFGARSYLGFPEYCGSELEIATGRNWNIVNLSKSGFTTIDLHRYLDVSGYTFSNCNAGVICVLIGTNDLKNQTSAEDFEIAYRALVVKIRVRYPNDFLVLLEIPHLHSGVMLPYKTSMNKIVESFNKIVNKISKEFHSVTLKLQLEQNMMYDGVHLNAIGSKHVGKLISQKVLSIRE